jgi:hypothetical protein
MGCLVIGFRVYLRPGASHRDMAALLESPAFTRGWRKFFIVVGERPEGIETIDTPTLEAVTAVPDAPHPVALYRGETPLGLTDSWRVLAAYGRAHNTPGIVLSDADLQLVPEDLQTFAEEALARGAIGVPFRINRYLGGYTMERCIDEDIENAFLNLAFRRDHPEEAPRYYRAFPVLDKQPGAFVLPRAALDALPTALASCGPRGGDLVALEALVRTGLPFHVARLSPQTQEETSITRAVAIEKRRELERHFRFTLAHVVEDIVTDLRWTGDSNHLLEDWITAEGFTRIDEIAAAIEARHAALSGQSS